MRHTSSIPAVFLAVLAFAATTAAAAQDSLAARIERVGTLRDPRLRESSGVAVSRKHPGILWTHNDSGDSATVYAINLAGDVLAVYRVPGALAFDWEDMALATCPDRTGDCLYIADTGDNSERRRAPKLYVVPEPSPSSRERRDTLSTEPAHAVLIRYADAPHDVEALAVSPKGDAYLVTKGRTGTVQLLLVPKAAFSGDSIVPTVVETLPIIPQPTLGRWVTGAAFSPSGARLVVRTYTELFFFHPDAAGRFVADGTGCWLGAAEPQGEGVTFLDEKKVLLTSESLPNQLGPVLRVSCDRKKA